MKRRKHTLSVNMDELHEWVLKMRKNPDDAPQYTSNWRSTLTQLEEKGIVTEVGEDTIK